MQACGPGGGAWKKEQSSTVKTVAPKELKTPAVAPKASFTSMKFEHNGKKFSVNVAKRWIASTASTKRLLKGREKFNSADDLEKKLEVVYTKLGEKKMAAAKALAAVNLLKEYI